MNRREFTRNALAAVALPAVSLPAYALSKPAASTATAARFWAIYMTHLHGKFTPQMLSQALDLDMGAARAINAQLVAEKVITPAQAAGRVLARTAVAHKPDIGIRDKLNTAVDMLFDETDEEGNAETEEKEVSGNLGEFDEQA